MKVRWTYSSYELSLFSSSWSRSISTFTIFSSNIDKNIEVLKIPFKLRKIIPSLKYLQSSIWCAIYFEIAVFPIPKGPKIETNRCFNIAVIKRYISVCQPIKLGIEAGKVLKRGYSWMHLKYPFSKFSKG